MNRRRIMIGMTLTFALCLAIIGCGRQSKANNSEIWFWVRNNIPAKMKRIVLNLYLCLRQRK